MIHVSVSQVIHVICFKDDTCNLKGCFAGDTCGFHRRYMWVSQTIHAGFADDTKRFAYAAVLFSQNVILQCFTCETHNVSHLTLLSVYVTVVCERRM